MKRFALSLFLFLPGLFAQTPAPAAAPVTQAVFDAAYLAAQPPSVKALMAEQYDGANGTKAALAATLAGQGLPIDVPIMVWGWDPYLTMSLRFQFGYTWVPSALQGPVMIAPGLSMAGIASYNPAAPPAGSIAVPNMNAPAAQVLALYPSYNPPAPPAPVTPTLSPVQYKAGDPVGIQSLGNIYFSVPGVDTYVNGQKYTDDRGVFQKVVSATPFGNESYWEKVG